MHLNVVAPTENKAKVMEVEMVVLNSVIMQLQSLRLYKPNKGVRFLWVFFVWLFF